MCQNVSCFPAFLIAVLTSLSTNGALLVQAVPTSAALQRGNALSSLESSSLSRTPVSAPAETHNGIAFISGRPAQGKTASYEDLVARMRGRQEQRLRREQAWQQEKATKGGAQSPPERPERFDTSHPLYHQYVMEKARQRAERLKRQPHRGARRKEEEDEEEEEETSAMYKNTIRACVFGEGFNRLEFCEKTGSVGECERLLDMFGRTNRFTKLKFQALNYPVIVEGKGYAVSFPLLHPAVLRFLAYLYYVLTERCNYNVSPLGLVLVFFEDGIDGTLAGENAWSVASASGGGVLGSAVLALKKAFSFNIPHYFQLRRIGVGLTSLIVKAASMRHKHPRLLRFYNFACRWKALCFSILRRIVHETVGPFAHSATHASAQGSPSLTKELTSILHSVLGKEVTRIAERWAVVLSRWLTEVTAAIFKYESGREEDRQ